MSDCEDSNDDFDDDSAGDESTPAEIITAAKDVAFSTLPPKSQKQYLSTYQKFQKWKKKKGIPQRNYSEDTLLVYFNELADSIRPPTLWARYSMVKAVIYLHSNVDISSFRKLTGFLKRKNVGYEGKHAKVFTPEQCDEFLNRAPDSEFLVHKVVMILGICGAMRVYELLNLDITHVEERGSLLIVRLPRSLNKNKKPRSFTIDEQDYVSIITKYRSLRPSNYPGRFFVNFIKKTGTCTKQFIGRNKLAKMPFDTAEFLHLENAEEYTGHSYRRTSGTFVADSGGNEIDLLRHGRWASMSTARRYIDESVSHSRELGRKITNHVKKNTPADVEERVSDETVRHATFDSSSFCTSDVSVPAVEAIRVRQTSSADNLSNTPTFDTQSSTSKTLSSNTDSPSSQIIEIVSPHDLPNIDHYIVEEVTPVNNNFTIENSINRNKVPAGNVFNFSNCNVTIITKADE